MGSSYPLLGPSTSPSKKAKVETTDSATSRDYSKMKVAELKKELESHGLDTSGKKADLTARLQGENTINSEIKF